MTNCVRAESIVVKKGVTSITIPETDFTNKSCVNIGLFVPIDGDTDCTQVDVINGATTYTAKIICRNRNVANNWLAPKLLCRRVITFDISSNPQELFVRCIRK